jgi:shikimate dehydrogenase
MIKIENKVFCILGDERVFRAKSSVMFSEVLKHADVKGAYVPFMVEPGKIGEAMRSIRTLNIVGANITAPYKESVISHLDILSEGANIIGAVNTVVNDGKTLKGYNTNAIGFMDTLENDRLDVAGQPALVFGTGGIARAVVFILKWLHADPICIVGRDEEKTRQKATQIGGEARPLKTISDQSISAKIVVNATSVSSFDEAPELATITDNLKIRDCELVLDMNYGRSQNIWKKMAQANGVRFIDGLSTLANQGRRTFALWTGTDVTSDLFLKALKERGL